MKTQAHVNRWITAGLAAVTVLSMASTAFADRGGFRRYKGVGDGIPTRNVIIRERSSGAGPALAGLIGGFILGAAVTSNARPVYVEHRHYCAPPAPVYRYYDPDDDYWYDSLDECSVGRHHPSLLVVIDVRSGREVRRLHYREGGWHRYSGDYDYDGDDD